MLEDTDLDVAVAEGIVSPAQAAALRELAARRTRERAISQGHEERFRFMRGFNDFFFAVGVVLFVCGFAYFAGNGVVGLALTATVMWALAELLVGRMRLVLPGILLATSFALAIFWLAGAWASGDWLSVPRPAQQVGGPIRIGAQRGEGILDHLRALSGGPLQFATSVLCAALAAAVFYVRFRLPFALLLIAAGAIGGVLGFAGYFMSSGWLETAIILTSGVAVFAAAMAFDMSDRERLTRRADCAFWLHLLAAPLIVHSCITLATGGIFSMTGTGALMIVLIFALLAVVAVAIDRRALLVSGLSYLGAVIATFTAGLAAALVVLGALVLALGVGWMPLRRRVMSLLSASLANRLPPVPVRS